MRVKGMGIGAAVAALVLALLSACGKAPGPDTGAERETAAKANDGSPAGRGAPAGAKAGAADDEAAGDSAAPPKTAGEADGSDDDAAAPSRATVVDGFRAVRLSAAEQAQTGVKTLALERARHAAESLAVGQAVDVQPLLELASRYHAARGEREVAGAARAASSKVVERLRVLHAEEGNISLRQLQEAEAQAAADAARLAAAERAIEDLRHEAVLRWGDTLAQAALDGRGDLFARLVDHREALVLVSLRQGEHLPAGTRAIRIGASGERAAREARLVSPAAQTDALSQGETWFFRTDAAGLRQGMRLDAWVPRGAAREGVDIPGAAVIWYANRLWVYVQRGDDLFVRKPLTGHEETSDGWFVSQGVAPGDRVVVSGAQMLFSEEFRGRIPSEDEGD